MKCVDGTKSLQYRDVIIKIDNGFITLLLLDGCQMEVFNIFSFSPDKIQFWQYTHISVSYTHLTLPTILRV